MKVPLNLLFKHGLMQFHLSVSWTAKVVCTSSPPRSSPKNTPGCLLQLVSQDWTWNQKKVLLLSIHLSLILSIIHCSHSYKEQMSILYPWHKSMLALSFLETVKGIGKNILTSVSRSDIHDLYTEGVRMRMSPWSWKTTGKGLSIAHRGRCGLITEPAVTKNNGTQKGASSRGCLALSRPAKEWAEKTI